MIQALVTLYNQHFSELLVLLGSGFVLNTISSLVVGRVNKSGKLWATIRVVHGILNQIDPPEAK